MLVCPQCNFENPNTNKFCQKCGTSLTNKTCYQCQERVAFTDELCPSCGALVGTFWQAVIYLDGNKAEAAAPVVEHATEPASAEAAPPAVEHATEPASAEAAPPAVEHATEPASTEAAAPAVEHATAALPEAAAAEAQSQEYLDSQQRYRLLAPLPPLPATGIVIGRVLDCQPLQKSLLEAIADGGSDLVPSNAEKEASSLTELGIPAIAQTYLDLEADLYPVVPKIHDAWQQGTQAIVLLEDRSQYQLLGDLWQGGGAPTLQIVYELGQMAQLWAELETRNCRSSLLLESNLRSDEDQSFCLQYLHIEPSERQISLSDLGALWQSLLPESERSQCPALDLLLADLRSGTIADPEQLRGRLAAIALELQPNTAAPTLETSPAEIELDEDDFAPTALMNDVREGGDDLPTVVLPMQLVALDDAGCTDIGRLRDRNEDCFGIHARIVKHENPIGKTLQAQGLYILCDGMGGHAGGEVASAMAVESLKRYFQTHWQEEMPSEASIREAVHLANKAIYDVNQQKARSGSARMGTTLVMVLIQDTKVAIAHVGDSRLYRLTRKRPLEQVTVDHEVGQREIQRGVEPAIAYSRPDAYQLTQALGPRDETFVKPDVQFLELNEDTLFLLCSDGMSDRDFLETHWQESLLPLLSSRANLEQGLMQLVELANQHNGHDNITALLIRAKVRPNIESHLPY